MIESFVEMEREVEFTRKQHLILIIYPFNTNFI